VNYGRLKWFLPNELDEEQLEYYKQLTSGPRGMHVTDGEGRLRGAFNARLLDPPIGTAIQELGAALRFGGHLSDRIREIVILVVARSERSSYEWRGHSLLGREAGMTDADIDALRTGGPAPTFDEEEQVSREVAQHLIEHRDLSDEMFDMASEKIGNVRIFDIVSLVGHYQNTATALRVWRVPVETEIDFK